MEFANRSGKITVELDDKFMAHGYIDGKKVVTRDIFKSIKVKDFTVNNWIVEETNQMYLKKWKSGYQEQRAKLSVTRNPAKEFFREHGVTLSLFVKVFNAAVYRSAIAPYKEFQSLFFGKGRVEREMFKCVATNYDILQQAVKDGQKNILPILSQGLTPEECKKVFGKGKWKEICSNTFHRNRIIVKQVSRLNNNLELLQEAVCKLNEFDSGAIATNSPDASHWLKNYCGITYKDIRRPSGDVYFWINIYKDTKNMSETYDLPFNSKWSKRKMKEKHDEYAREAQERYEQIRAKKDEEYKKKLEILKGVDLGDFYAKTEFEYEGVVGKIITTYEAIKKEGIAMHHCVGGYAERAVSKEYVVVHFSGDGEETTLGIYIRKSLSAYNTSENYTFEKNQHYGKCNSHVKSGNHRILADKVIQELNEMKMKGVE